MNKNQEVFLTSHILQFLTFAGCSMEMFISFHSFSDLQSNLMMKKIYSESEGDRVSLLVFNFPAD